MVAYAGSKHLLDYGATKGTIVAFTRCLALQLAEKNVNVNAVAPGPIWTPLQPASRPEENLESVRLTLCLKCWSHDCQWQGKPPPLGRIGQPGMSLSTYSREQRLMLCSGSWTKLCFLGRS